MEYQIIRIEQPKKTNNSSGNWVVHMNVKYKDYLLTNHMLFFFRKADAIKYIKSNPKTINIGG